MGIPTNVSRFSTYSRTVECCMSITFSGMGYEMVNQIIVVEKGHHANIVQVVKMCYKIKINYRESKSCFYGVLLCKQHPRITIEPLLQSNSATTRQ